MVRRISLIVKIGSEKRFLQRCLFSLKFGLVE